jgi:hypothetical protein
MGMDFGKKRVRYRDHGIIVNEIEIKKRDYEMVDA